MDKDFTTDLSKLYAQLQDLGERARQIITEFVKKHGGNYTFDTKNEDLVYVGSEIYVTALKIDSNECVLVFNSAQYSEYLHRMEDYSVLDLAEHLYNIDE